MDMEIFGFDELNEDLKNLERNIKDLQKPHQVSLTELFTTSFMQRYTPYNSFAELLDDGGFVVNSSEDFEAIPDELLSQHIAQNTNFNNWEEFSNKAASEYAIKKLGF